MNYKKTALTFKDQITLLQARGLTVSDTVRAERWLNRVSYYHLSAYYPPFETSKDVFRNGATFEDVAALYNFDRKLRLLVLDAIERIEVAVRTHVTYELGHFCGPFGYSDSRSFQPRFNHQRFMNDVKDAIDQSHEDFIGTYFRRYTCESLLPIWMVTELLSFGTISHVYAGLPPVQQRRVATRYNLPANVFGQWLHSLSYVRNVCAHHCRFWNRELAIKPMMPNRCPWWPYPPMGNNRPYCIFVICSHLLRAIAPNTGWRDRLVSLFKSHSSLIGGPAMGLPADYDKLAPWA